MFISTRKLEQRGAVEGKQGRHPAPWWKGNELTLNQQPTVSHSEREDGWRCRNSEGSIKDAVGIERFLHDEQSLHGVQTRATDLKVSSDFIAWLHEKLWNEDDWCAKSALCLKSKTTALPLKKHRLKDGVTTAGSGTILWARCDMRNCNENHHLPGVSVWQDGGRCLTLKMRRR